MRCEWCGYESEDEEDFVYPWMCTKCEEVCFEEFVAMYFGNNENFGFEKKVRGRWVPKKDMENPK